MRGLLLLFAVLVSGDALADAKAGEKKAQLCLLCHKTGNVMAHAPLLEAQPAKYLVIATTDYKTGKRPDPVMKANVANLSARDIRDISDYFSSRPPIVGAYTVDSAKVAVGEKRVADLKCATCHGTNFSGADIVPRLAGQAPAYLVSQLEAFARGARTHPQIDTAFDKIGDLDALATYFTSLK
jgi:cytochrome c553